MIPRLACAVVCVVLVSIAGGCGANTYATQEPRSNVTINSRVVRDGGLSSSVVIESARIDERGGAKFAQVTIRNVGQSPRKIQYRIDWFDADGVNVTPLGSGFRSMELGAVETRDVQASAASRAEDFRITIRSGSLGLVR